MFAATTLATAAREELPVEPDGPPSRSGVHPGSGPMLVFPPPEPIAREPTMSSSEQSSKQSFFQ